MHEINHLHEERIGHKLPKNIKFNLSESNGNVIRFDNGCCIDMTPENGYYFGTNPYGIDWMCNADNNSVSVNTIWLNYWNEARTETGELIEKRLDNNQGNINEE